MYGVQFVAKRNIEAGEVVTMADLDTVPMNLGEALREQTDRIIGTVPKKIIIKLPTGEHITCVVGHSGDLYAAERVGGYDLGDPIRRNEEPPAEPEHIGAITKRYVEQACQQFPQQQIAEDLRRKHERELADSLGEIIEPKLKPADEQSQMSDFFFKGNGNG